MKEALKLGVIYGVISLLISIAMMSVSVETMFTGKSFLIMLASGLVILIMGGRYFFRKIEDIDLSYGVAVKYLFVSAFVGSMISLAGTIVMYGNDEEVKETFVEYSISTNESAIRGIGGVVGMDEATIENQVEKMRDDIASGEVNVAENYPFSVSKIPFNIAIYAITALIYALILALFVRVKHPT